MARDFDRRVVRRQGLTVQGSRLLTVRLDGATLHVLLHCECARGEELEEDFRRLPDFGASVVRLDMSSVMFANAQFMARLIFLERSLKAVGARLVVVLSPSLGEIFRITRLDRVFEVITATAEPLATAGSKEPQPSAVGDRVSGGRMKPFSVSTFIRATPEAIWAILTDGARWTEWNPTVEKVEGTIAPGGRLKVFTRLSPGRAFPVKVSEFVPLQRMVWTGGMPLGLFKGVRTYTLTPASNGTQFTMREEFSGLMAPLITRSIPDLQPSFDEFATALKSRAEHVA
jgi:anti-anti-sigma regulatory factor